MEAHLPGVRLDLGDGGGEMLRDAGGARPAGELLACGERVEQEHCGTVCGGQGPGWDAGAGLWGGLSAGGMRAGSDDVEAWAEPGAGGARDAAAQGAGREGAPGQTWS